MSNKEPNWTDPSQNFIDRYPQPLDALFHPNTVAVIGAKDDQGSVGRTIMFNLLNQSFKGKIYPVNPKRNSVFDIKAYRKIGEIPDSIDLAILVTPAITIPGLIQECVEAKVKSIIIISAGFKEMGEAGQKLENEILKYAHGQGLPIIGPNCLGVMNPICGLNATFAKGIALPGNIAFLSQSGAMCTAVLDWSLKEKVGFSAFVSLGSMIDVNWGTLIDYLGSDPNTHSLLLYMETVGDARAFMTAAREVALEKPIIIIKAGRSQEAANAAASHTGSLAGSDEVFDAALERIGVLRVDSISDLFNMASVLSKQPLPKGPNLTIITNAGGPGVLATDAIILNDAKIANLSDSTKNQLDLFLPNAWSHSNPVDILGDASADRYKKALAVVAEDSISDGVLVILSPQDMTQPTETAQEIISLSKRIQKTLLTSWMGGETVEQGSKMLSHAKIPVFEYPDNAAFIFAKMWKYNEQLKLLYEVPESTLSEDGREKLFINQKEKNEIDQIISSALSQKRTILTEFESKNILLNYGIPTVQTFIAYSEEEAIQLAKKIGFPVVLKLFSDTITHKTDVGGVKLNLNSCEEVRDAFQSIKQSVITLVGSEHFDGVTVQKMIKMDGYELILGSSCDVQFGSVILFGTGGQLVEVYKDRALAIPPLNRNLARQLMKKTKIYEALKGVRGRPAVDLKQLEDILIKFSLLIVQNPRIKECDINPLLVSSESIIALDARVVLHDSNIKDEELPKLAIRPYPTNYIKEIVLKDHKHVILRPIKPEDEGLIIGFHKALSESTVRQRFFEFLSFDERVTHDRLIRICFNDYDREWAIVADYFLIDDTKIIVGIGRLTKISNTSSAQIKMTVIDDFHHLGLGMQLLNHLLWIAEKEKISVVDAYILSENTGMLKICERSGFELLTDPNPSIIHAQWRGSH